MNVLSLFDGISCARMALKKANIPVKHYYASEIDKYAITASQKNHPEIKQLGNVKDIKSIDIPIDILIGGSPCQDLSVAKKDRKGLEGDRSSLFWEYVRIKDLCKPKWFILENVASMRDKDRDTITKALGVQPVMFCASLVSAQRRKRYFWTNIPFTLPTDRNIVINDILVSDADDKYFIKRELKQNNSIQNRVYSPDGKTPTLLCHHIPKVSPVVGRILGRRLKDGDQKDNVIIEDKRIRRLTPIECERLQGLPDNYTEGISETQRYKCLGNAFNVDVVAHILSSIH